MQTRFTFFTSAALVLVLLAGIAASQDPIDTIRIDSDLVDLKVSVLGFAPTAPVPLLDPKDFLVLEDGVPQEISFFAAADTPFKKWEDVIEYAKKNPGKLIFASTGNGSIL